MEKIVEYSCPPSSVPLFFLPGCDDSPARPKADFYSYRGFRDWWRIPLRFPYQITMVDALEYGTLEKYDPASLIADPKCETVVTDIVAIGYDGKFVAFRRKNIDPPFGILIYTSGIVRYFAAKDELDLFIRSNFPGISLPSMVRLDEFYALMWKMIDKIRRNDPQELPC